MEEKVTNAIDIEIGNISKGKALTAEELLNKDVQSIPKLVDPLFQKTGLVAVGGSSDVGKSTLLRQLAIAIATNQQSFLGFPINAKYNKAIYVSTEDDEYAISYLLNKYNAYAKFETTDYNGLRFIFEVAELVSELDKQLTADPADIVIIDAFTDLYSGKLNEANKVRTFLNEFSQLSVKHETLFVFLHHTGKRTDSEPPSKHNLLGSQAFEAKMRCVIELREDKQDATKRHLCVVKGNYLPKQDKTESHELRFEDLIFSSTGGRVHYSELITGDEKQSVKEEVRKLKEDGLTQTEISKKTGVPQPTINRWLRE